MSYQIGDIQGALQCISSTAAQEKKNEALKFLEYFQKSSEAWTLCYQILDANVDSSMLELQIFASQTLRSKVTYDLHQLQGGLQQLKESLLNLLAVHSQRLVVTQLSVALARLAIQFLEWRNPVAEVITVLNPYPAKLLGFLKILPEETLDIKSTPLTEDDFQSRTHELIVHIANDVLDFLVTCINSVGTNNEVTVERILGCLSSWSYEFPIEQLLTIDPLISLIFQTLNNAIEEDSDAFEAAVDCLCIILRETRDVSNEEMIKALYQQLLALQNKLLPIDYNLDYSDHYEAMDAMTRLYVEAGEAWCVFIAKNPQFFKPLVSVLLFLTCKNSDLDIVKYTFPFWFNLKQMLVLTRFKEQRLQFQDIYVDLIKGIISHLSYPLHSFTSREEEDKFKDFRYDMGDVLKDCAAVVGPTKALTQPFNEITETLKNADSNTQWQKLEAPLFSLRTMAQEVPNSENTILPQLFRILCSLPEHPKIRYAATLVLGRYTEWTSHHPEFLEMEMNYILNGFQSTGYSQEIIDASSTALMYFFEDCSQLLSGFVEQLLDFYWKIQSAVDEESLYRICVGLSAVINEQPAEKIGPTFELFLNPYLTKLEQSISVWHANPADKNLSNKFADEIYLLEAILKSISPRNDYPDQGPDPLEPYISIIWNTLRTILIDSDASTNEEIVMRTLSVVRTLLFHFHVFCKPILPSMVELLIQGYESTGLDWYLWCSASVIRTFGDDESFPIGAEVRQAVWRFALSQCISFMKRFEQIDKALLNENYGLVQSFFIMVDDILMFYPQELITSDELLGPIVSVGLECITKIENYDGYFDSLHTLEDLLSWGFETPPISTVAIKEVPVEWRQKILKEMVLDRGQLLVNNMLLGLVSNFCDNAQPTAFSCLISCSRLATQANNGNSSVFVSWISNAVDQLGKVTDQERNNLLNTVGNALNQGDHRKARKCLEDFVGWYLRKNVSPRLYK